MPDPGSQVGYTWPATKISPPSYASLVSRPRLLQPLNVSTAAGRVTLVVAPGGSGKSTLLADWVRQAPTPVAWYTMDLVDRDTRRMVIGLCAAIERVLPGSTEAARRTVEHGGSETAAIGLLLAALENRPLTIVLDDFHHLDDLPEATALWEHLFRFRPPTLALVILSRTVPLLGFAMLAAMDALLGLGRTELSFSPAEAAELLDLNGLDSGLAAQFVARTDGWATGVLMLARTAPGGVRLLHARADALMDQLGSEILVALPDGVRNFLLESASLGPVTPDQADTILDRQDSYSQFADVLARGLFVTQNDGVFRYHDLFAEHFVSVLKYEQPARLREIREKASAYWCANDDLPRALGLLADEEDWPALAALLEQERNTLWARGMWGTAIAMVERLPAPNRTPRVLSLAGSCHTQRGNYTAALSCADEGMAAATTEEEWLACAILHADVLQVERRFVECIRGTEGALEVAQRVGHTAAVTRLLSLLGRAKLGLGDYEAGKADMLAALEAPLEARDESTEAMMLYNLGWGLVEGGRIGDSEEYLARASAIWTKAGNNLLLVHARNVWAIQRTLAGDLTGAEREAERALALLGDSGDPLLECNVSATLATIYIDQGENAAAERLAARIIELAERIYAAEARNEATRALIAAALARRDRAMAKQLIDDARQISMSPVDAALLDMLDGTQALRSRAYTRAAQVLGAAAERLENLHRPHFAARAYLLQAEGLYASGAVNKSEEALRRVSMLVLPLGCEEFLRPTAKLARQVLAERHALRRLRRDTRGLLDRISPVMPALTVVGAHGVEVPTIPSLRVSPFGAGKLFVGERTIDATNMPPRAREVLFYAARKQGVVRRSELLEHIWEGDTHAAQSLWDASRHVRRVLGERSWSINAGSYELSLAVQDDGLEFEAVTRDALSDQPAIQRLAAAERAMELAAPGPFLEWCDSLWATSLRAHYAKLIMSATLAAAGLYERLGRAEDATRAFRQAANLDPLDETPRMALIRCLGAQGHVRQALQEYRAYRRLVRDELSEEPSVELRKLVANIGRGSTDIPDRS